MRIKNTMRLCDRYENLIHHKPHLAVRRLPDWTLQPLLYDQGWTWQNNDGVDGVMPESDAIRYMLSWWIGQLPIGVCLRHLVPKVWTCGNVASPENPAATGTCAFDALLAFWEQRPSSSPYGKCPTCGARGVFRERRPNGNDKCERGHEYPSASAICTDTQGEKP